MKKLYWILLVSVLLICSAYSEYCIPKSVLGIPNAPENGSRCGYVYNGEQCTWVVQGKSYYLYTRKCMTKYAGCPNGWPCGYFWFLNPKNNYRCGECTAMNIVALEYREYSCVNADGTYCGNGYPYLNHKEFLVGIYPLYMDGTACKGVTCTTPAPPPSWLPPGTKPPYPAPGGLTPN